MFGHNVKKLFHKKNLFSLFNQKMANSKYEYVRENEDYLNKYLLNDCYTVIRIDGSHFHHFSFEHNYIKPNDKRALDLMNECALYVVKKFFPNIICAYGQSDEYSFILSKNSSLFNRRLNKLNSMLSSAFSSAFVFNWAKYFHQNNYNEKVDLKYPPIFDSRCVLYTSDLEIKDYIKWRQVDCHINNLYNTTFYALTGKYTEWIQDLNQFTPKFINFPNPLTPQLAEKRLQGTISVQKRFDILKGLFNIDYDKELEQFKKGSFIVLEKKDENKYREWCLKKNKKKVDNIEDFIDFKILHSDLIKTNYLDEYLEKMMNFSK